jgi:hypothetical protein
MEEDRQWRETRLQKSSCLILHVLLRALNVENKNFLFPLALVNPPKEGGGCVFVFFLLFVLLSKLNSNFFVSAEMQRCTQPTYAEIQDEVQGKNLSTYNKAHARQDPLYVSRKLRGFNDCVNRRLLSRSSSRLLMNQNDNNTLVAAAQHTVWKESLEKRERSKGNKQKCLVLGKQFWPHISSTRRQSFL